MNYVGALAICSGIALLLSSWDTTHKDKPEDPLELIEHINNNKFLLENTNSESVKNFFNKKDNSLGQEKQKSKKTGNEKEYDPK
jgi:hypothetical protein